MLRAAPFFPALDVNLRRIFHSRLIISVPRIISIAPCLTAIRSPVACSSRNGLGVGPSQIIFFFFFDVLQTGVVPD
jgi:hypothetical protein